MKYGTLSLDIGRREITSLRDRQGRSPRDRPGPPNLRGGRYQRVGSSFVCANPHQRAHYLQQIYPTSKG